MKIKHLKANDPKDIALRLREIRLDARMTQREMAELIGLSPAAVGAMENSLYTPNFDVLRAIKHRLNISYDYIIDGVKPPVNTSELISENRELKDEIGRLKKMVDKLLK
jgi:transcriptional regulator with XRE-family HTH domain